MTAVACKVESQDVVIVIFEHNYCWERVEDLATGYSHPPVMPMTCKEEEVMMDPLLLQLC